MEGFGFGFGCTGWNSIQSFIKLGTVFDSSEKNRTRSGKQPNNGVGSDPSEKIGFESDWIIRIRNYFLLLDRLDPEQQHGRAGH